MRGYTKAELEAERPPIGAMAAIAFCLKRLYEDQEHYISEEVVAGLSFEELLGSLLVARDELILFWEAE